MKHIPIIILTLLQSFYVIAVDRTSVASGNWNTPGTWSPSGVPVAGENVTIAPGHTVTVNVNASCADLTISSGALTNSTYTFAISGSINNSGTFTSGSGLYTLSGAAKTLTGTLAISNLSITGTYTNNGNFTVSTALGGSGTLTNGANATLTLTGTCTITTLTATANPNTVIYNSATANQTIKGTTYHHLTISKTGRTGTLSEATTVNGNLSVTAGTLTDGGYQITGNATGTLVMSSGTTLTLGSTTAATQFPTNFTTGNITLTGSTVIYNSNVAQTIFGVPVYHHLTLTSTAAVTKTAAAAFTMNGNLTINTNNTFADGGYTITIKGNITNNRTHSGTGKILLTGGTAAHALSGGTSAFGNIELNDALGATFTGSGTTTINGNLTITAGTMTCNAFTTALVVSGNTSITGTLSISSTTGTKTFGNITVNPGGTWNSSSAESYTINGNIQNNNVFTANTGVYTLAGSGKTIGGTLTIPSVTVNGTYSNTGTLTVSTALAGSGTLTNSANATLNLTGTCTVTNLTATSIPNAVIYNSTTANQTIKGTTYHHLTISKTGRTGTLGAATTINGNLAVTAGTLADGGYQITGNATGTLVMSSGTTLSLGSTTASTQFPTNFTTGNITLTGSTVIYNSNVAQTISAIPVYDNLTLAATGAVTKTAAGALSVNGNLAININNTLADGGYIITVKRNVTNNGTHSGAGKILLTGGSAVHALSGATSAFGNVELNDALGGTFTGSGTTTINGNLTITAGAMTCNGFSTALVVSGNTSITGTLRISSATGTKTFGNITVNPGGTWNSSTSETYTINGNIQNNNVFTANTGVYTLAGSGKTIGGTLTIPSVTVNGTYSNTGTLTVSTALAGSGTLTNSANATLNLTGTCTVSNLTATAIPNTVVYNSAAAAQTIKGSIYHHLTISKTGYTSTLGAATTVNGNLAVTAGTLADGGYQITGNATGTLVMSSGTTLTLGSTTAATQFPTNFTTGNITLTGSTVIYNSNVAQTISGVPVYHHLTLTSTAAVTKTAAASFSMNGNLTINTNNTLADGGYTITVKGNITNNNTHSGTGKILLTGGTAAHALSGVTSAFGNVELNDALGATFTGSGTTTMNGNLTITAGTMTCNAFTTALVVSGNTSITGTLIINSTTGTKIFGNITVNPGGTWNSSSAESYTINGNIQNNNVFTANTGVYTLAGSGKTIGGTLTIPSVTVNGTYSNTGTLTVSTALAGSGTLTNSANATLNLTGTCTVTNLAATAIPNTVVYNSTAANQTIKGTTYHHLTINKTGRTGTLGAATTINGNLAVTAGTLADGGYQITGNATGTLVMSSGTTLTLGSTTAATQFPTNFPTGNITLTGSTVIYNSNVAQTISAVPVYQNLSLAASAAVIKTVAGVMTVNGNLTLGANNTFADAGNTITVKGNITNNGIHSGVGKILLTGGSASHSLSGTDASYENIELNDINGATITSLGNVIVNNNITVTAGTFTCNSFITGLTVNGTISISGIFSINSTSGTKTFNNITVNAGGSWNCAVSEDITLNGNILNNNTFTSNTGTYTLAGSGKTLQETLTFQNLAVSGNYTNNGTLLVNGVLSGAGTLTNGADKSLTLSGSVSINNIDGSSSGNTITYNSATVTQNIKNTVYHHLVIDKTNQAGVLAGDITVNGNLLINSGILDDAGYQISGNATGAFQLSSTGTLYLRRTSTPFFPSVYIQSNIVFNTLSKVYYMGSGAQTISAEPASYGDLIISGSGKKSLGGNIDINGNLTISSDTLYASASNYSINMAGNFSNDGVFAPAAGMITFDGNTTLSGSVDISLNHVEITGDLTGKSSGNFNVSGNWSNNGTFTHNNGTITFNGNGTQTVTHHNSTETFNHVTIQSSTGKSSVVIPSTQSMIVEGTLTVNDSLTLKSNASGTAQLIDNGTIAGSGVNTSELYVKQKQWHYTSSPISNAKANSFKGVGKNLYYYNETSSSWVSVGSSDPLTIMKGYDIFVNQSNPKTSIFSGNFNTGSQSIAVTQDASGWNLIGNPYPSAIDWDAPSGWTKTNINNAIYIWNHPLNNFSSYIDGVGTNGGSQYIAPMQGFWVSASGDGSVEMNNDVRLIDNISIRKKGSPVNTLFIQVKDSVYSDETIIRFNDFSTNGYDSRYDAYKKFTFEYVPQIYTKSEEDSSLSINAMPLSSLSIEMPLFFKVNKQGTYLFQINGVENFTGSSTIFLEDKKTNTWTDLTWNNTYSFLYELNDLVDRFSLHFSPVISSNDNRASSGLNTIHIYSNDNRLYISNPSDFTGKVEITDNLGRNSYNNVLKKGNSEITLSGYKGFYIIRVITSEGVKSKNILIE